MSDAWFDRREEFSVYDVDRDQDFSVDVQRKKSIVFVDSNSLSLSGKFVLFLSIWGSLGFFLLLGGRSGSCKDRVGKAASPLLLGTLASWGKQGVLCSKIVWMVYIEEVHIVGSFQCCVDFFTLR